MGKERLEARVSGRVQGVGFRAYTRDRARSLGLVGGVNNGEDGAVYIVAEGPREQLEELIAALRRGPGQVQSVETAWRATTGLDQTFEVWR